VCAGGGAPEIEVSRQLGIWSRSLQGMESYCVRAFADAMEVIVVLNWLHVVLHFCLCHLHDTGYKMFSWNLL
jgi:hypothetical protein